MKISNLKQPYRRMAEYLVTQNYIQEASDGIYNLYKQGCVMDLFCNAIDKGHNPPITEEIKKHFPPDFDFSEEEIKTKPVMQMLDAETQKYIYTQLAKDGKYDELPDTCEFIMPITLEVFDKETKMLGEKWIVGKFRGRYVSSGFNFYLGVKLPTQKIDFSEFNIGDVVEVETESYGVFFGMIHTLNERGLVLTFGKQSGTLRMITDVKSIKKIK